MVGGVILSGKSEVGSGKPESLEVLIAPKKERTSFYEIEKEV